MLRDRLRRGVIAGIIAGAATGGVLMGLGRARGSIWSLLNDAAHTFVGGRARIAERFDVLATPVGVAVHLLSLILWGILFAVIGGGLRGWRLLVAAFAFTAAAFLLDTRLLPVELRPGFEAVMTTPELLLLYATMAIALALGVRESVSRDTLA